MFTRVFTADTEKQGTCFLFLNYQNKEQFHLVMIHGYNHVCTQQSGIKIFIKN